MRIGILKIKNAKRLRRNERNGRVPVLRLWNLCFVWIPTKKKSDGNRPPPGTHFMKSGTSDSSDGLDAETGNAAAAPEIGEKPPAGRSERLGPRRQVMRAAR
jgi:hypothetical protein